MSEIRNDLVYLEEVIARKNERIALLEKVAVSAEIWAKRGDSNSRHERDVLERALRAAGYLEEGK